MWKKIHIYISYIQKNAQGYYVEKTKQYKTNAYIYHLYTQCVWIPYRKQMHMDTIQKKKRYVGIPYIKTMRRDTIYKTKGVEIPSRNKMRMYTMQKKTQKTKCVYISSRKKNVQGYHILKKCVGISSRKKCVGITYIYKKNAQGYYV